MKENIYLIYVGKDATGIYWNDVPLTTRGQCVFSGYPISTYEVCYGVGLDNEWFCDLQYGEVKQYKIVVDFEDRRIVSVVPQKIPGIHETSNTNNINNKEDFLI